jgi:rhamnosyltransferase
VPVNNARSNGIERLVDSLKKQTYKNIEFIAVDSGSTDDTVKWLKKNQFKVLEIKPKDFTHAYSRNMGASIAKGKYLLFTVDDAVFDECDWLYSAIALLIYYKADSYSSLQCTDSKADAYAKLLNHYLKESQSDGSGFNISKTNIFARILFRFLPFQSKVKAIAIDDTNHLVRADVFKKIKYKLETVEDLDFGIRLTKQGYKFIYSNILTITHYHEYPLKNLAKYAKRVYLDNYYFFAKETKNYLVHKNRDSLVISALLIHSEYLKALDKFSTAEDTCLIGAISNVRFLSILNFDVNRAIENYKGNDLEETWYTTLHYKTILLYKSIFADEFPAHSFFNNRNVIFLFNQFSRDIVTITTVFERKQLRERAEQAAILFNYLWVSRVMTKLSFLSRKKNKGLHYKFDDLSIASWK